VAAIEVIDAQLHRPLPLAPWPEFDSYAGYPRKGGDVVEGEPSSEAALAVGVELLIAAMEAAGVDAGVVHSNPDFCEVAVARHPERLACVLDLYDPAALGDPGEFMAGLRAKPGHLGIRLLPGIDFGDGPNLRLFLDGAWEDTFAAAAEHGVPIEFFAPLRLALLDRVAREYPGLRVIVDHVGMPAPPTAPPFDDLLATLPELLALAVHPNVAVKLTGLPLLAPGDYPFPGVWPALRALLEAFGPGRLLWGTDVQRVTGRVWHPPLPTPGHERINYAELLDYLLYSEELDPEAKAAILGGATREWLGWPR
jgi:L-fuconolactonase